jgi:hypothetical protein
VAGWAPTSSAMRFRLSPSRYINTHSASGARRNCLSMMGVILPRRPPKRVPSCRNDLMPPWPVQSWIYQVRQGRPKVRQSHPVLRRDEHPRPTIASYRKFYGVLGKILEPRRTWYKRWAEAAKPCYLVPGCRRVQWGRL